jgi:aminopeptidase-like protein
MTNIKFGECPEYHTSLNNFDVVTEKGLNDSLLLY